MNGERGGYRLHGVGGAEAAGLSAAGTERKGEILHVLVGELSRRRRRRWAGRIGAAVAALALMVGGAAVLSRGGVGTVEPGTPGGNGEVRVAREGEGSAAPADTAAPAGVRAESVPAPSLPAERRVAVVESAAASRVRVVTVATDSDVVARLAAGSAETPRLTRMIGDAELLAALEEAGGGDRFGIVRIAGHTMVVCQSCGPESQEGREWIRDLRRIWERGPGGAQERGEAGPPRRG